MRLSINLREPYYRAAKALSKAEDCSLSSAVNQLIAAGFEQQGNQSKQKSVSHQAFPTSKGRHRVTATMVNQIEQDA